MKDAIARFWATQRWSPFGRPKVLLAIPALWALTNLLPWDLIYHAPGFETLVSLVATIVPMIDGLQDSMRFGGLEYSKAQLTFISIAGILWTVYAPIATQRPPLKHPLRWGLLIAAAFGCLIFPALILFGFTNLEDGRPVDPETIGYNEARWTFLLFCLWTSAGGLLGISAGIFKLLLHESRKSFL